ncbi:hypothetical protein GJ654_20685 [Rhodoblastus acidophilus]|uniref:Uncharacterized protein n=1 Tax=Rhodoblastus acidophilus TaxID=1074 RepID=A0A6N8DSF7_RHOAC|nr:hypothetical protein [Rhodoblastus acidophilus]
MQNYLVITEACHERAILIPVSRETKREHKFDTLIDLARFAIFTFRKNACRMQLYVVMADVSRLSTRRQRAKSVGISLSARRG